ncbi:hypothetical protein QPK31_17550 [Massilia sp. YIM B02769]|uniref:hypothetical protein n=1 Tax=unclassified Massilia TaxID=2609279 RepID=UPI0025B6B06F|nr:MULTISPECIES: hypothetical protein [unclassified Massilia]MDN4060017.1 hypothetical protein [Massilia sp. YIM B02769]
MDHQGAFFGLPLPVVLAFVVLLLGLVLMARLLHGLRRPAVVRHAASHADPRRSQERD